MKHQKNNTVISISSVLLGLAIACTFSLAAIFLGAILISGDHVGESGITLAQFIVHFLSVLLGCFITERMSNTNKFLSCCVTGAAYYLTLIATACLFFDGVSGRIWLGIIPVLGALLLLMVWITKTKGNSKRYIRRKSHR